MKIKIAPDVEIDVDDAIAPKVQSHLAAQAHEIAAVRGEAEAQRKAAAQAAAKVAEFEQKMPLVASTQAEFKAALEAAKADAASKQQALRGQLAKQAVLAHLASDKSIVPSARRDIADAIAAKATWKDDANAVMVDDKPLDQYLTSFLADRPHFIASQAPPGSGGTTVSAPGVQTINRAAYRQAVISGDAKLLQGLANGTVKLVD